jgi:hypothetical protein
MSPIPLSGEQPEGGGAWGALPSAAGEVSQAAMMSPMPAQAAARRDELAGKIIHGGRGGSGGGGRRGVTFGANEIYRGSIRHPAHAGLAMLHKKSELRQPGVLKTSPGHIRRGVQQLVAGNGQLKIALPGALHPAASVPNIPDAIAGRLTGLEVRLEALPQVQFQGRGGGRLGTLPGRAGTDGTGASASGAGGGMPVMRMDGRMDGSSAALQVRVRQSMVCTGSTVWSAWVWVCWHQVCCSPAGAKRAGGHWQGA